MSYLAKLACATLSILPVTHADTAGKPPSTAEGANSPSPPQLTGFSTWKPIFLQRDGVVNPWRRKDFNDTRFEYRWKSERGVSTYVCTIEIRLTGDVDGSDTAPEIGVMYVSPRDLPHHHGYTERNVRIGSKAEHAYLKPTDCERVDLVYWLK
jgi:hypothetical protein